MQSSESAMYLRKQHKPTLSLFVSIPPVAACLKQVRSLDLIISYQIYFYTSYQMTSHLQYACHRATQHSPKSL